MPFLKYWLMILLVGCSAAINGPAEWERVLEDNLGSFYLPIYKKQKLAGEPTAWDYVVDRPGARNVLIIGDSISRGYTLPVREALSRDFDVFRAPENSGSTTNGLKRLDLYLATAARWDVIVFNFGIHDGGVDSETYRANLRRIVSRLRQTGSTLLWVRTTPFGAGRELLLNHVSDQVMTEAEIYTIDAGTQTVLRRNQLPDHVHFPEPFYVEISAPIVAAIRTASAESGGTN